MERECSIGVPAAELGFAGIAEVRAECRQYVAVLFDLSRSDRVPDKALDVAAPSGAMIWYRPTRSP